MPSLIFLLWKFAAFAYYVIVSSVSTEPTFTILYPIIIIIQVLSLVCHYSRQRVETILPCLFQKGKKVFAISTLSELKIKGYTIIIWHNFSRFFSLKVRGCILHPGSLWLTLFLAIYLTIFGVGWLKVSYISTIQTKIFDTITEKCPLE